MMISGIKISIALILCFGIVGAGYAGESITHELKEPEYLPPPLPSKDAVKKLESQLREDPNNVEILIELGRTYH